jgi:hypothetical protein
MYGIQATLEHIATMIIKSVFHDTELPAMRRFIVVVDPDSRLAFRRCAATSAEKVSYYLQLFSSEINN